MALAELLSDTKALIKTYSDRSPNDAFDARAELSDNVLPLLEAMLEATIKKDEERDEYIAELGEYVDQLVDESEVLQAETTKQIIGTFEVGKLLCNELDAIIGKATPVIDDMAKKRIAKQVKAFRAAVAELAPMLIDITLDDDDEEPAPVPGMTPIGDPVEDDDEEYEDDEEDESAGG